MNIKVLAFDTGGTVLAGMADSSQRCPGSAQATDWRLTGTWSSTTGADAP